MSVVTNLIFCEIDTDCDAVKNIEPIENINEFLKNHYSRLTRVDDIDGPKGIEARIWLAAASYFFFEDLRKLGVLIKKQKWESPDCVQLFIKWDGDNKFRECQL